MKGLEAFIVVVILLVLIAWLVAIHLLIDAGKKKGHFEYGGTGVLWFVGIFASPIVVGLYVTALPDKRANAALDSQPQAVIQQDSEPYSDELPDL